MGQKLYFWMLLIIFLSLGFLIQVQKASAMTAAEIEPGVVEVSTTNIYGFEIQDVAEKKIKDKTWVYFCMAEKMPRKKQKSKCFYGLKQDFGNVKVGLLLNGIQYGLKKRISNANGIVAFRKDAYFYPARIVRPQYVTWSHRTGPAK